MKTLLVSSSSLVSSQKEFLVAYQCFYGEDYIPEKTNNTEKHVKAQKLYYLLSHFGMDNNEYGFVWHKYGPFSVGMQNDLHELDSKRTIIEEFYSRSDIDKVPIDFFINGKIIEKLVELKRTFFSNTYCNTSIDNKYSDVYWIELIASLAFIKNTERPYSKFLAINEIIKERKKHLNNDSLNEKAWELLEEAKIIT